MVTAKPARPKVCLLVKNTALDEPMNRTPEVGAVRQQLVRITQVLDRPPCQAPNDLRPKPDE